jgi:hypothetical protein
MSKKSIRRFYNIEQILNAGINTFSAAAFGNYNSSDEAILELGNNLFSEKSRTFRDDKIQLLNDKKKIASDMRTAFNRVKPDGKTRTKN